MEAKFQQSIESIDSIRKFGSNPSGIGHFPPRLIRSCGGQPPSAAIYRARLETAHQRHLWATLRLAWAQKKLQLIIEMNQAAAARFLISVLPSIACGRKPVTNAICGQLWDLPGTNRPGPVPQRPDKGRLDGADARGAAIAKKLQFIIEMNQVAAARFVISNCRPLAADQYSITIKVLWRRSIIMRY